MFTGKTPSRLSTFFDQFRTSVTGIHSAPARSAYDEMTAQFYALHQTDDHSTLLSISDPEGKITYANGNFCDLSEYSLYELIGKPQSFMQKPEDAVKTVAEMQRTFAEGKVWQGVLECKDKKGKTKWLSALTSPVLDATGKTTRYINIWKQLPDASSSAA